MTDPKKPSIHHGHSSAVPTTPRRERDRFRRPHYAHRRAPDPQPPRSPSAQSMRDSMSRLPWVLHPGLTWLTGLPGQEHPLIRWTPVGRGAVALVVLLVTIAASTLAVQTGGWLWLTYPLTALIEAGALRWVYIIAGHFAAHGTVATTRRGNAVTGELASTLTLTQPHAEYERDHAKYHHSSRLGTARDPDAKLIAGLGFLPGMSRAKLWRHLAWTLVSPRFHVAMTWGRLQANARASSGARWFGALAFHAAVLAAVATTGLWRGYLLGWVVPLTVLFNVSALLQFLSEHRWFRARRPDESMREHQAKLTFGRFLGDPLPSKGHLAVMIWALRMLFLHLPARLFVLVGDLPQHDLHHQRPRGDWANAAFTRRDVFEADRALGREDRDEVHGSLARMIDEVFLGLEARPPLTPEELDELGRAPR